MSKKIRQSWENATWAGSRRTMIRQSLELSVRERLQALQEINKTSERLASTKKRPVQS